MSQKAAVRRRRYFLPNSSQPRLLLGLQLAFAGVALAAGLVLFVSANRDLSASYQTAQLAVRNVQQIFLPVLIGANLLGLALSGAALVFLTHRVAGPAYNLGQVLAAIARGDLTRRAAFRKSDYLKELEPVANQMTEFLRGEIGEMRRQIATVEMGWEAVDSGGLSPELWRETAAAIRELRLRLDEFHLPE